MMRITLIAVVTVAVVGMLVSVAPADTQVTQYRTSGKSANFYQYAPGGLYVSVSATEYWSNVGGTLTRYVRMNYSVRDYSTTPYTYSYGYGEIPASDFTVAGNSASLDTDTADGTWNYQTGDDNTFEFDWDANGQSKYTSRGTTVNETTYPNGSTFRSTRVGLQERFSADVEGTLDDDTDVAGSGWVYDNSSVSITLVKD